MKPISTVKLLFPVLVLVLFTGVSRLSAKTIVAGYCRPGSYHLLQDAINAAPVGAKILLCPTEFEEQIKITKAVTLQGIADNGFAITYIGAPTGGLVPNATNSLGRPVSAQVLVENSAGPVNITGVSILGGGTPGTDGDIVGIFYQNSPGTVNGVSFQSQANKGSGFGVGLWIEGGSARPSVTVQNSFFFNGSYAAIFVGTSGQPNHALTAKIANNSIYVPQVSNGSGITAISGATVTATGNTM